jgi:ABC-type antimicrobial peptide transport system permease subunit
LPGIVAAAIGSRIIRELLFEVEPLDLTSFIGATLFLVAVVALACLLPALRALRIDPVRALRAE